MNICRHSASSYTCSPHSNTTFVRPICHTQPLLASHFLGSSVNEIRNIIIIMHRHTFVSHRWQYIDPSTEHFLIAQRVTFPISFTRTPSVRHCHRPPFTFFGYLFLPRGSGYRHRNYRLRGIRYVIETNHCALSVSNYSVAQVAALGYQLNLIFAVILLLLLFALRHMMN